MDYFIGDIELFPYTYAPQGWSFCDGRTLQIQENTALFALIGTKFGGDGRTIFALPNLQGFEGQPGLHYCICREGFFPTRD